MCALRTPPGDLVLNWLYVGIADGVEARGYERAATRDICLVESV